MDPDEQTQIKALAEQHPGELVVILGSPSPESARVYAETLISGDPAWAGPLAGVSLKLPVYHILEDPVKDDVDRGVYEEQVSLMEMALDAEAIIAAMAEARAST